MIEIGADTTTYSMIFQALSELIIEKATLIISDAFVLKITGYCS